MFYIKIQLLDSFSFVLRWAICAELYEIVCEFATNNTLKDFIVNLFFFSEEEVFVLLDPEGKSCALFNPGKAASIL
jgi:hypothetical protein